MSKNAIVLRKRGINHGDDHHPHNSVIRNMSTGQFNDWRDSGIVREATPAEASGTKPKPAAAAKPKAKAAAKPKAKPAAKPAPAPAADTISGAQSE